MTRAVVLAVTLVAVLAEPALANGAHGGTGPSSLLIAAGAVLVVGGIWSAVRRQAGPMGWLAAAVGAGVVVLAFVLAAGPAAPNADVIITRPVAGAEVPAGEPVQVKVQLFGGDIATSPTDQSGGHLHLYVDGDLQQMPYSTTVEVELAPGKHSLRVEYVDHQHLSFDPEIDATIDVVAQ